MTTATWRDLADQLTPGQVQHLSRREELLRRGSRHRKDDADIDADLLGDARPIERQIVLTDNSRGADMTADRARELGRLLLDAADVLDRLSAVEATVTR